MMLSGFMYIAGIALLIPAFVLFMQFASQGNAAATSGSGLPLGIWLAMITAGGAIAHVIALAIIAFRSPQDCRWCFAFLAGYAIYIAGMVFYISSGGFVEQVRTSGILSGLAHNIPDLVYIVIALAFVFLILAVKSRALQADGG